MDEKFIEILGLNTRYLETSASDSTPVLILHGWGSSLASWREVAEVFERAGKKVMIPDLPGFGETKEPPMPWSVSDYINFLENFLEKLRISKFILAGHSFGGQLAIAFAAQQHPNIQAVCLMAAARIMRRRKLRIKIFRIVTKFGNLAFTIPIFTPLRSFVQKVWYKFTGESDYYVASPLMRETLKRVLNEEVAARLQAITIPTLILWGKNDEVTPLEDAYIIQKNIRGSRMHIFKGVGHDVNFKVPQELANQMITFINSLDSTARP